MSYTAKTLPQSQMEFSVTVAPEDYKKHMDAAAVRISERVAIKGFRKGKAPYDKIKQEVGEMNILNEALERIVQESFYAAVKEEDVDTIGMPDIKIDKVAPGNALEYKATVALMPNVKLPKFEKIKIKKKNKEVGEEQITEVLENLTKMQAKEVAKDGAATLEDVIVMDMNLKHEGVPIEGGQATDYKVYLSEKERHIPGFNDELVGLKKDDEKTFEIPFPKEYHNTVLAGNKGEFTVRIKEVLTRDFPEVDEAFAKSLGQDSVEKLKELLKGNLQREADQKADQAMEIEIFDTIIEKSKFDDIPEVLINAERKKMFYELQRDLDRNGISVEQYLADIKKTEEEIQADFTEQATKRAKASVLSRQIAKEHAITVSDEELQAEIDAMKKMYKEDKQAMENLGKDEVKDTIRNVQTNKKVVVWLKEQVVE